MATIHPKYITDETGKTTGVFIPILEWNELKVKYKDIEQIEISETQIVESRRRLDHYKKNPESAIDFDVAIEDIEREF